MYLRQILTVCPQFLPHEGHGIEAQKLDALISQKEHLAQHGVKDRGVRVFQIPLEGVEGRPDPAVDFGAVGEVARRVLRKNLAEMFLVLVRQRAVREHEEVILIILVARQRVLRPLVFVAGVIKHEIEHHTDAVLPQRGRQIAQVCHRSQRGINRAVAANRVAAVANRGYFEERHQMQIGQSQLLEVGDFLLHARQITGEQIDVADSADHPLRLEPERVGFAPRI